MIRSESIQELPLEEFKAPFAFELSKDNRWVKLATLLPWEKLASIYYRRMSHDITQRKHGRPCKDARVVIGALIIKHKEGLSDRRTIESIRENVYQQYFLGLSEYTDRPVFDPTLFVNIRKRLGAEAFDEMVEELMRVAGPTGLPLAMPKASDDEPAKPSAGGASSSSLVDALVDTADAFHHHSAALTAAAKKHVNVGMLIVDMTVTPADIAYPTDIELLNTAREKTEHLIDVLYAQVPKEERHDKPRTYRERAHREYLAIAKLKKRSEKTLRKALRKQLNFVLRNITTIRALLTRVPDGLVYGEMREFWVIQELYRQQSEMYEAHTHRTSDRIVSVTQPHVRPIVRGKAAKPVEFGAQVSLSVHQNGFNRIHRIEWDAYNEGSDLQAQIESYKSQYGSYPEIVLADKKYGTRENRAFMREHGITYGGTPLGRPKSDGTRSDHLAKATVNKRNWIEGRFGTGKRSYGLDNIRAKRADTSESWIAATFFMMNLSVLLKLVAPQLLSLSETLHEQYPDLGDLSGQGVRKFHFVIS